MAARNFDAILSAVLQFEGGFVNDPRDPGGATNRGITQRTLSQRLGRKATVTEVRNLSRETAADIYRKLYWDAIGGDTLAAGVDALAMDIAVNSGVGRASQWLRDSANLPRGDRIRWLDRRRRSFWRSLKTFAFYGKGWMRRENAMLALALKLDGAKP